MSRQGPIQAAAPAGRGGRLRRFGARAATFGALSCCALGAVGLLASDRFLMTQYISWAPGAVLWPAALVLAMAGFALADRPRLGWRGRLPRAMVCLAAVGAVAALAGIALEWRVPAVVNELSSRPSTTLRVVNWNMTSHGAGIWEKPFAAIDGFENADLLLLTTTQPLKRLRKSCLSLGEGFDCRRVGMFSVASRFPIMNWELRPLLDAGQASALGLDRRPPAWAVRAYNWLARDTGAAVRDFEERDLGAVGFLRVDTTPVLGRPLVVWFIDLPSNPLVSKLRLATVARARLARLSREVGAATPDSDGFPGWPDLVIGDMNIPRGSASLDVLGAGLRDASAAAGPGRLASWPRAFPLWHLDQALASTGVEVASYALVDAGESDHKAQVLDISIDPAVSGRSGTHIKETAELPLATETQP
ncbi:MAG TPA: hypothetical protein DEB06_11690 [Phycisphaerales bacterium]|nr:hypothetical protein [Phycisphaerales bacterium]